MSSTGKGKAVEESRRIDEHKPCHQVWMLQREVDGDGSAIRCANQGDTLADHVPDKLREVLAPAPPEG